MRNMSIHNGTHSNGAIDDLDIIEEYLQEHKARDSSLPRPAQFRLPGPPPPPPDSDIQTLSPVVKPRVSTPVLVPRGAAPQSSPQHPGIYTMASLPPARGPKGGASRRGRGSAGGRCARQGQTDTEQLERLLNRPQLVVVEHPKERGMRFRYECEGRSAGSILGASSTEVTKTLPAIELQGPSEDLKKVTVTVSLVTKDLPHRPHPHCLVGKDCKDGICVIQINPHIASRHSFANLGIQCVRRKELDASLEKRRNQNIDPFNTGHSKSIEDMDMNVVRLCFQCELERDDGDRVHLSPVVSNPIYDKKATTTSELRINRLNVVRGPCTGKTEIYMLCDKVQKDDIDIIFGLGKWEAKAEFAQTDVHRQIAIVFKSPPYQEQDLGEEVEVNVFLRRLSDRMDSEPVKFTYMPDNTDPYEVKRKRKIKTDIKFTEGCSMAAQSMMPEPSTSHQFDRFPFTPLEIGIAVATSPQEEVQPQPSQALEEIHYTEDFRQEENVFGCMDQEMVQTLLRSILDNPSLLAEPQQSYQPFADIGNLGCYAQDPNANYASPDFLFSQPQMNIHDIQFSLLVNGNQPPLSELDQGFLPPGLEGLDLGQVKAEPKPDH